MVKKILVANRDEIAVRVMRACRDMGIASVAAYAEADKGALFVRYADESCLIGPSAASRSCLDAQKIVEKALECGAETTLADHIKEIAERLSRAEEKLMRPALKRKVAAIAVAAALGRMPERRESKG